MTPASTVRRVVSTRMPTRWGAFALSGFERETLNGSRRVETALAVVLGDLTEGAPLLRIHSECFQQVCDAEFSDHGPEDW